jgi:hypothetical protein
MTQVSTINAAYSQNVKKWELMRDVLDVDKVKAKGTRYLPQPSPEDASDENKLRYAQYVERAQFLGVTGRTIEGLVGAIFRRSPQCELPASLDYLKENADGSGNSLEQLSKMICGESLTVGRGGLLSDYPSADEGLSAEDVARIGLSARIAHYPTESIINWRTRNISGQQMLDMVVLCEVVDEWKDEFASDKTTQYRVLIMRDGVYHQELYDDAGQLKNTFTPRNSKGALWTYIPFQFYGAKDNTPNIATPPLYALANLNIGWYRNSADLEESTFICGQPSLFVTSDMSAAEFKAANPNGVRIGSRTGHLLGATGSATMLQAAENNLANKGMKDKEEQMLQIGARLVGQGNTSNETAQAARIRAGSEVSVLSTLVLNAGEAIEWALTWCGEFMGATDGIEFKINTEFFDDPLDAQQITALMGLRDSGVISQGVFREKLRKGGIIDPSMTDEEIDAEIAAEGLLLGGDEGGVDGA